MEALDKKMIALNQQVATQEEGIRLAGQLLVDGGCVEPEYIDAMQARNQDVSVYMGNFIAIPHGTEDGMKYIKRPGFPWSKYQWVWAGVIQMITMMIRL